jgi:hypothetical protein
VDDKKCFHNFNANFESTVRPKSRCNNITMHITITECGGLTASGQVQMSFCERHKEQPGAIRRANFLTSWLTGNITGRPRASKSVTCSNYVSAQVFSLRSVICFMLTVLCQQGVGSRERRRRPGPRPPLLKRRMAYRGHGAAGVQGSGPITRRAQK